jgi:transcriptional regulator with XRE-family HTH domain
MSLWEVTMRPPILDEVRRKKEPLAEGKKPKLFGEVLREFRNENKISVSSLSQISGITPSGLFRIENKDSSRTPNRSTIATLLLSLSFLSGKSLEDVYGYFKENIEDQKQLHQVYEGKEIALRLIKISRKADKIQS